MNGDARSFMSWREILRWAEALANSHPDRQVREYHAARAARARSFCEFYWSGLKPWERKEMREQGAP